jgi:predicted nucleic acid-binding protein
VEKPKVYLDTNIISAYWYEGNDVAAAARRFYTSEWWNTERQLFAVYVSVTTINELRAGSFRRQADCLKMVRALPRLPITRHTKHVLDELAKVRLLPETKTGDALQMAVSAAHQMDYLLTWNYAHLANPVAQERLEVICRGLGLRAPLVVSPETIPQVRFGQTIRRIKP